MNNIHELLSDAWRATGIDVTQTVPISGQRNAPNPTRISITAGPQRTITCHVFAWRITHEGKGRSGDNLRIQATSFGQTNSPIQIGKSVLGVGWSEEYCVFVGFDPWVKRNPGTSSSIHIKRNLLVAAVQEGRMYGDDCWDPRIAVRRDYAGDLLQWANGLWKPRTRPVRAMDVISNGPDHIQITVDPRSSASAHGVRIDDRLAVSGDIDNMYCQYLWRVEQIGKVDVRLPSGRNRFHYTFLAAKSARVPRIQDQR